MSAVAKNDERRPIITPPELVLQRTWQTIPVCPSPLHNSLRRCDVNWRASWTQLAATLLLQRATFP